MELATFPWSSVGPALPLLGYVLLGAALYLWRGRHRGWHRDSETAARGESALLRMSVRQFFTWLMRPLVDTLVRLSVPANALTTLSLLLSLMAALAVATGAWGAGGWLYLLGGACDFLDGRVARQSVTHSKAGAALDSVLDRYVESAFVLGLMWHFRSTWLLLPAGLALVGSLLVPYVRARGEGLGVGVTVGFMQRPERVVVLGLAIAVTPIFDLLWRTPAWLGTPPLISIALCSVAFATQLTALQRLYYVFAALESPRRRRHLGPGGMARAATAALVATGVDFEIVMLLVLSGLCSPWLATLLGALVGGATNFTLNRTWTFRSVGPARTEAGRYVFVSGSSAVLNSAGVWSLLLLDALDYRIAWLIARGAVFVLWNYPLQRNYVFAVDDDVGAPHAPRTQPAGAALPEPAITTRTAPADCTGRGHAQP